jgi:hypothetical protein
MYVCNCTFTGLSKGIYITKYGQFGFPPYGVEEIYVLLLAGLQVTNPPLLIP